MAKRELLRKIDQEPGMAFTGGSVVSGGSATLHRMLSSTHSDSDAADTPVNGDFMMFDSLWKALSIAEVVELIGGLFVGRYEGAHAGLFAYDHEDGLAIELQVTDTGGQPFLSAGAIQDVPNSTWLRFGYPEYDQITLSAPTSGSTDPEQHRPLDIPAGLISGYLPASQVSIVDAAGYYAAGDVEGALREIGADITWASEVPIADLAGHFAATNTETALAELAAEDLTFLKTSGERIGAQTQPQWFTTSGYFGSGADFAGFDDSGVLELHGDARAKQHVYISVDRQTLGGSAPTRTTRAVGASGDIEVPVISFSSVVSQETFFEVHTPASADGSVNVQFHLMWFPGSGWSAGNYMWKLDYLVKDEDGASLNTGAPTTIQASVTPTAATDVIETRFVTTIDAGPEQVIWCRLWRDVANDNGDGTGEVRFCEIEYTLNRFGESL